MNQPLRKISPLEVRRPILVPDQESPSKTKIAITKGEKFIYFLAGCILLGSAFFLVSNQSEIYVMNKQIQDYEQVNYQQERINADLEVQIAELSTYERIWAKAKELGLELNENNVKVVQK